jgi:hypothetical protein
MAWAAFTVAAQMASAGVSFICRQASETATCML